MPTLRPSNRIQICFGGIRHERLRPVKNSFSYGTYFLRLPLRTMASANDVSTDTRLFSRNRFNFLSFYDRDHGDGCQPPMQWIETQLKNEGIHDADGEIWLQAFPRVLGFVFNPVSFWFCHRSDGALRAVVCEVRNTFGEKHCYLLDTGKPMPFGIELSAKKVFHVSPFCAVAGGYRFRFMRSQNALRPERIVARIEHDDLSGPLLLTSIHGTSFPLTDMLTARAFFCYPFMTFGVVARIHWQALRLWIKRVPFFGKPVPPIKELSR